MKFQCDMLFVLIITVLDSVLPSLIACLMESTFSASLEVRYCKNSAFMKQFLIVISVAFFYV